MINVTVIQAINLNLRFLDLLSPTFDGGTINPRTCGFEEMRSGFWASFKGDEVTVNPNKSVSVARALATTLERALETPDSYIGIWVNDGSYVFDLSTWFADREQCLEFARENGQKAIWDCANSRPINVD